jgi:hypothetical protein
MNITVNTKQHEGQTIMDLFESYTHSFIIKIWLEEINEEAAEAKWRGHITHVPSGERRYLKDLDEIRGFIVPYLEVMGVKFGICWRVRKWLGSWKSNARDALKR